MLADPVVPNDRFENGVVFMSEDPDCTKLLADSYVIKRITREECELPVEPFVIS
jgi:hypothetical protein